MIEYWIFFGVVIVAALIILGIVEKKDAEG